MSEKGFAAAAMVVKAKAFEALTQRIIEQRGRSCVRLEKLRGGEKWLWMLA